MDLKRGELLANLEEALRKLDVPVGPRDGLLLVRTDDAGRVHSHVLRLGLMTEGRLEASIMPVFNEIVKARVIAANTAASAARQKDTVSC